MSFRQLLLTGIFDNNRRQRINIKELCPKLSITVGVLCKASILSIEAFF